MKKLVIAATLGACAGLANAAAVIPLSYVATPGQGRAQGGTFNYFDDTGRQLIDGVYGVNWLGADLGNGEAFEWVAWKSTQPTIVFQFDRVVSLASMTIGLNRREDAAVYTRINGNAGGALFSIPQDLFPTYTRGDFTFNFPVPFVGSSMTLSLVDNYPDRWIFVDEITFQGTPASTVVPLPGALALMLPGLALLGAAVRRRAA